MIKVKGFGWKKVLVLVVALIFVFPAMTLAGANDFQQAMGALSMVKDINQTKPIMLDPLAKGKIDTVYLEISFGAEVPTDMDLIKKQLEEYFSQGGYTVVDKPEDAGYIIQVSIAKFLILKENKNSGFLSGIGSTLGGLAGLSMGAGLSSVAGMKVATEIGSAVGGAAADKAESGLAEALTGKKFSFMGKAEVTVTENLEENTKQYTGSYPLLGEIKDFNKEKMANIIAEKLNTTMVKTFKK